MVAVLRVVANVLRAGRVSVDVGIDATAIRASLHKLALRCADSIRARSESHLSVPKRRQCRGVVEVVRIALAHSRRKDNRLVDKRLEGLRGVLRGARTLEEQVDNFGIHAWA